MDFKRQLRNWKWHTDTCQWKDFWTKNGLWNKWKRCTEVGAGIILKMKRKRVNCKPGKTKLYFAIVFPADKNKICLPVRLSRVSRINLLIPPFICLTTAFCSVCVCVVRRSFWWHISDKCFVQPVSSQVESLVVARSYHLIGKMCPLDFIFIEEC